MTHTVQIRHRLERDAVVSILACYPELPPRRDHLDELIRAHLQAFGTSLPIKPSPEACNMAELAVATFYPELNL